jgi:hypothetical protein
MLKTKSTFFLLALTVATAFAANFGSFFTKITTNRSNKENRVKNSIPPPVMCSGRSAATVVVAPELWSNPATWGGVKPVAGQTVTIAANKHIILDENTPILTVETGFYSTMSRKTIWAIRRVGNTYQPPMA